jgi:RNA polymerase sigma-70 factor, ECF subfamily
MDDATYARQVTAHLPVMLRAAGVLVGKSLAEDAVQEALVRAWQSWPSLRDTEHIRGWLLRIVVNLCLDWRKGHIGTVQKMQVALTPENDEMPALFALGDSDHTAALDLRMALETLDSGARQIITLRYYAGLDATEIGAVLCMSPATVRTRLRRALKKLQAELSSASFPPSLEVDRAST